MDAVFLARLQFALAAGFHYLFPPTTFGLTFVILIVETLYLKTGQTIYRSISGMLVKMLGLVFVMGAATGISLEFAFGTNWSEYSRTVGDIFGAPLAAEGIFAFFLESIFLGVLIFGREKVSRKTYWASSLFVFIGSHLSGVWILIANSFMQTPAGYRLEGGKAVLTNFFEAAVNHSTVIRVVHTTVGGWITGSLLLAGISAWYLLKGRGKDWAGRLLKISLIIFIASGLFQLMNGHFHSVQVAKTQPEKMAAFEGLWETQAGAPLSLFGIPDEKNEKTHLKVGIPKLLSLGIHFDANATVQGLKDFPADERPPVLMTFATYHIMILLGTVFVIIALWGGYLMFRKGLLANRWFLRVLLWSIPLPYIANEVGWIAAEVGRQPWAVYRVLKTSDAASVVVPAGQILATLIMFVLVYSLLFWIFMRVFLKIVKKGPAEV